MDTADVIARLQTIPVLDLPAVALLLQLDAAGEPDPELLVKLQPEIEQAIKALSDHSERTGKIVDRCLRLRPIPTHTPPPGF
jgi:hypothetical protein